MPNAKQLETKAPLVGRIDSKRVELKELKSKDEDRPDELVKPLPSTKKITVSESLRFLLTPPEFTRKSEEIRELRAQSRQAEDEMKATVDIYKARIRKTTAQVEGHLNALADGHEYRTVEAEAELDFKAGTATIWHEGQAMLTRKMTEQEWTHRTERLYPEPVSLPATKADDGAYSWQQDPKKKAERDLQLKDARLKAAQDKLEEDEDEDELPPEDAAARDAQIKDVMKAETSKKSKKSAV